jgi:hypothetical protein
MVQNAVCRRSQQQAQAVAPMRADYDQIASLLLGNSDNFLSRHTPDHPAARRFYAEPIA